MSIRIRPGIRALILTAWAVVLLAVVVAIGPGNIASSYSTITPQGIRDFVVSSGGMAELVFLVISVVRPAFFLPVSPFTVASGFLFGFAKGLALSFLGTTLSAVLTFFLSRYLLHDFVHRQAAGRYPLIEKALEGRGWNFVLFLRVVPAIPFDFVGYLAGASRIRFRDYLIGTILGELPGAVVLVLFGASLDRVGSAMFYASLALAVVVLLAPEAIRRTIRWRRERLEGRKAP